MLAFDETMYFVRMENGVSYTCLGTLDWTHPCNASCSPAPFVSIDEPKLLRKVERRFPGGLPPPDVALDGFEVHINVPDATWNPMSHIGAMPRLSPDEDLQSVWAGMARAADPGTQVSDASKKIWAKIRRNVVFKFRILSKAEINQGAAIVSASMREARDEEADKVLWSPRQRAEFVMSVKLQLSQKLYKKYEQISIPMVFKECSKVQTSERREPYKETFCAAALQVGEKLLSLEGVKESLAKLEEISLADETSDNQYINSVY